MSNPSHFPRRDAICRLPLKTTARFVLYRIADYAGNSDVAFPSQARLASDVGISERHLRNMLRELEVAGYLSATRQKRKVNRYALNWQRITANGANLDRNPSSSKRAVDRNSSSSLTGTPVPPERSVNTQEKNAQRGSSHKSQLSRWARAIKPVEFNTLDAGLKRFDQTTHNGWLPDEPGPRLNFMCAWQSISRRMTDGNVRSPGGLFAKMLADGIREGRWSGCNGDEDAVRAFLRDHDRLDTKTLSPLAQAAERLAADTEDFNHEW